MEFSTGSNQPDHIVQLLVEGAQEMLGMDHLQQIACAAREVSPAGSHVPANHGSNGTGLFSVAGLPIALENRYGAPGGRGLALRIGRAAFKYMLQRRGEAMGLTSVDYRLQRAPQRMKTGLHLLAEQLMNDSGDQIFISESDTHWVWRSERCPVCWGRDTGAASCYLTVGLIQEFLSWSGGGRYYRVTETECRAAGASACSFAIEKKPLD